MSDDFVLNVKQIAQYPLTQRVDPNDVTIVQKGGLGGPYMSMLPTDLVGTAMLDGGFIQFAVNGGFVWGEIGIASDGVNIVSNANLNVPSLHSVGDIFVNGIALANQIEVTQLFDSIIENSVITFNGRKGNVLLEEADILKAGGILQNNPHFTGIVLAPTLWDTRTSNDQVATTAFVQNVIASLLCSGSVVVSFNGRGGDVWLTADDITLAATQPGAMPRATTPPIGDASGRIATTMFVDESLLDFQGWVINEIEASFQPDLSLYAPLASPNFSGVPTAPTAAPGSATAQIATCAFVENAVTGATAGVASFNTRTGAVTLIGTDIAGAGGALLASPAFTGTPQAPTAVAGTNTGQLATTAFVHNALVAFGGGVTSFNTRTGAVSLITSDITGAGGAPLTSPALGGTPTAPTAAPATNTTQIATTAFVQAALAAAPGGVSSWNGRQGAVTLQANDLSAVGGALLASPAFSGVPTAPTATAGTNTTQLATTAFVQAALGGAGVSSFNGRTGAVSLITSDITTAGGAPISSPTFTGTPNAPTQAQTVNDTSIATTAYVRTAISAATGVASFNSRTGVVTLTSADVTSAGGALLASPTFTGTPRGPTAAPGDSSTLLATTAFVAASIAAAVSSFNGRTGAVVLIGADISGAGGAMLASPTFSGTPNAPTPTTGTNNTQIATTAFVNAAITAAGGVTFKIADAAPTPASNFWFDSVGGQLYVNYVDPVSSAQTWVVANSPQPVTQPPASGSRVLITSFDVNPASPPTLINFFNGFDGTYDLLELDCWDVVPASQQSMFFRCSADGSTFDSGAFYHYFFQYVSTVAGGPTATQAVNASAILTGGIGSVATNPNLFRCSIRRPSASSTARFCLQWLNIWGSSTAAGFSSSGGGIYATANTVLGLQIQFQSGVNITRGSFRLYGIVK